MPLRIYADTNVYCRPFDDQQQLRIRLETEAILKVLMATEKRQVEIVGSDLLLLEADRMSDPEKREGVLIMVRKYCRVLLAVSPTIHQLAETLQAETALEGWDAFHVAAAVESGCEAFLTCDQGIVKVGSSLHRATGLGKILAIQNPIHFLRHML